MAQDKKDQAPLLSLSLAPKIALYSAEPGEEPADPTIEIHQAQHRINLLNFWRAIRPGDRVLELGCGQGNCTTVLAEAVGPAGHVDAVDPAPGTYGAPITLAQAHANVSASAVGDRITWHTDTDPVAFLKAAGDQKWDVAVLAHCVWYFREADMLKRLLVALRSRVPRVCVAEYALAASEPAALPHVLAALARGALEAHRKTSEENIQTLVSPAGIKEVVSNSYDTGLPWEVKSEAVLVPEKGLRDGFWEVQTVVAERFVTSLEKAVQDPRVRSMLKASRDATISAVDFIGGKKYVRTMDVWAAVLESP